MGYPSFNVGDVLASSDMNAVGMWRITDCTVTSVGGTAATASNGVITVGANNTSLTINAAFSANYDNYLVIMSNVKHAVVGGETLKMRMGTTAANYYGSYYYDRADGGATGTIRNNNDNFWWLAPLGTNDGENSCRIEIRLPQKTTRTTFTCQYAGNNFVGWSGGQLADTTAYTSLTIFPNTGSISGGNIRVYGMRN